MGVELNLLTEPQHDLDELKAAIALHKQHRTLIHNGDFQRLDTPDTLNIVGVVAADKSEALWSVAYLAGHAATLPGRLYPTGLDADASYRVRLVWPIDWRPMTASSVIDAIDLLGDGAIVSGDALTTAGMQLPLTVPQTVLIFYFHAV
jgi:alpha-galactosidase